MPGFPPPWSCWTALHHRCFEDCRETQRDVQSLDSARIQWTQQMWIVIPCQWWQLLVIPTWWTICNRTRSDGAIAGHYRPIRMKITTTIIYFSYATAERQRMLLRYLIQDVAMDGRAMEWAAREVAQAWLTFRFIRRLHTRGPTAPRECSSSAAKLPLCISAQCVWYRETEIEPQFVHHFPEEWPLRAEDGWAARGGVCFQSLLARRGFSETCWTWDGCNVRANIIAISTWRASRIARYTARKSSSKGWRSRIRFTLVFSINLSRLISSHRPPKLQSVESSLNAATNCITDWPACWLLWRKLYRDMIILCLGPEFRFWVAVDPSRESELASNNENTRCPSVLRQCERISRGRASETDLSSNPYAIKYVWKLWKQRCQGTGGSPGIAGNGTGGGSWFQAI